MPTKTKPTKATGKGQAFSTLVTFDTRPTEPSVRFIHRDIAFDEVPTLGLGDYRPHGGTPLYDAVKATILSIDEAVDAKPDGVHFAFVLDESGSMSGLEKAVTDGFNEFVSTLQGEKVKGKGRVMVIIFTDGMENSSRNCTQAEIQGLVKEREAMGWVFSYMGADHDVWRGAGGLGIDTSKPGSTTQFNKSVRGTTSANSRLSNYGVGYLSGEGTMRASAQSLGSTVPEDEADPNVTSQTPGSSSYDLNDALSKARGGKPDA